MGFPANMNPARKQQMEENFNDWHSVGTKPSPSPPALSPAIIGATTRLTQNPGPATKVTPLGMVKSVKANGETKLLSGLVDNATADRITGPVKQFDMQQMMQQRRPPQP
jgi:hypothetical protein